MRQSDPAAALAALLALMARLRDPEHGCPWDRAQDFKSIAPYTLEEAYEVREAIERDDPDALRAELGDLLFQVVFHARLGEERGWFDFAAVAAGIHEKLIRRHPHLFGAEVTPGSAHEQSQRWEDLKALERADGVRGDTSALADIPLALPALMRAGKLGRRAGRVGFDWAQPEAVRAKVLEELGDLLFQVVFHARMAEERGWFDFAAVARSIHEKLLRRHPHVFGGSEPLSAAQQSLRWDERKAQERAQRAHEAGGEAGALADVPLALPALMRAAKLSRRAARVGFDWERAAQVREKVLEELAEIDAALGGSDRDGVAEELGDLLFAVANWSRHLSVDPEEALRTANTKFERRFRRMEQLARERGMALGTLGAAQWEALWQEVKREG